MCLAWWSSGPPGIQADKVDRDGSEYVCEVCLGQAEVTAAAYAGGRDRLVNGALDAHSERIPLFPLVGRLFGTGPFDSVVKVAGRSINCRPVRVDRVHCGRTRHV